MRLTGSRVYARPAPAPTMPPGLVDLMEGLAKDVLKNNPENIYEFCAGHMQKLLEIRDGPRPPKKQLSLEQKIARAQDKIRQKMKNKQPRHDKKVSEQSNESCELENESPVIENPIQNLELALLPVAHGVELASANEVEIFHEPNVTTTTNDVTTEEAAQIEHEVKENIAVTVQKFGVEELSEKANEEVKEDTTSDNTKQISDIGNVIESENVADVNHELQNKEVVECKSENIERTEKVSQDLVNNEVQLDESELIVDKMDNDAEEKPVNLHDEGLEKEVVKDDIIETSSSQAHEAGTEISYIDGTETVQMKGVIEKDENITKEELVGLIEKDVIEIGPEEHTEAIKHSNEDDKVQHNLNNSLPKTEVTTTIEKLNDAQTETLCETVQMKGVIEKYENITKEELVGLIKKDVIEIGPEEHAEAIKHSNEDDKVQHNLNNSLPKTEVTTTIEELNDAQTETLCNIETLLDEHKLEAPSDAETPDILNTEVPANGAELVEDKVITVESAEEATIDDNLKNEKHHDYHDVHRNYVDYMSNVDKQIIDTDNKLPEQDRANSGELIQKGNDVTRDDTSTINTNNTIIESDERTENTAVSGMDLETAAITIQKVFRTFLFSKSRASTLDDTVNENSLDEDIEKKDESDYLLTSANLTKERRALGISRMDTVLQTVNEEKSLSMSDDSSLSSAATTIQAHVRGYLVRNRLASNKTASSSSLVNSDGPSTMSLDGDANEPKKTVLNIHIVPERGQFVSRDESLLTSIDLPLDISPPSSINLHPLGYDKSERRKQLKREDAVQSISPPSNNSGKLSEEVDSVAPNYSVDSKQEHEVISMNGHDKPQDADTESCDTTLTISSTAETVVDADTYHTREVLSSPEHILAPDPKNHDAVINSSSDEMDVVTPFPTISEKSALVDNENDEKPKLVHSGEFHDIVVQTQVKRSESSVVREFKNVLAYFLIWDKT